MKIKLKRSSPIIRLVEIKFVFIYLIFMKPSFIEDVAILDTIWNVGRFGLTILYVGLLVLNRKSFHSIIYPAIVFLIVLLSTIIHQGTYSIVIGHWLPMIGYFAFFELNRDKISEIVAISFYVGGLLIALNAISIIVFPDGFWLRGGYISVWLLGQKQDFVYCFLSTILFGIIYMHIQKSGILFFCITMIAVCFSLVIAKPLGLVVGIFIIVILTLLERFLRKDIKIQALVIINLIGEVMAISIAYIYANLTQLQLFFESLPTTGMSKLQTMVNRFDMWTYAFEHVIDNPIFGLGQVTLDVWYKTSSLDYYHTMVHNLYLDIAFTGGVLALAVFIAWYIAVVKKLKKTWTQSLSRHIGISFFAFNIVCIIECPYQPMAMLIFTISLWIDDLIIDDNNMELSAR